MPRAGNKCSYCSSFSIAAFCMWHAGIGSSHRWLWTALAVDKMGIYEKLECNSIMEKKLIGSVFAFTPEYLKWIKLI